MSFDAWGKRREVAWAAYMPVPAAIWQTQLITRGFTGHEQLDQVGLVHMNGRVYDPELGRFLSADPHIQDVTNGQALNRYSYVLNNPLSFTDPSGFFFQSLFKAIGRAVGAVFRAIGRVFSALLKSAIFRGIVQVVACAPPNGLVTCAAVTAGLTLATGGSLSDALTAGAMAVAQVIAFDVVGIVTGGAHELVQIGTHGTVSGAFSVAQGGEFHTGFISGAVAKGTSLGVAETGLGQIKTSEGFYMRTAITATSGGVASVLTGGKFMNGAVTAAFAHMYNQEGGEEAQPGDHWRALDPGLNDAIAPWELFGVVTGGVKLVTAGVRALSVKFAASSIDEASTLTPNAIGKAGEEAVSAVYDIGQKAKILVNGRVRYPDGINAGSLSEVKNRSYVSLTSQIKDYITYALQTGRQFQLFTRPNTTISKPIKDAIQRGDIIRKDIP